MFLGLVMYANEVKTTGKIKITWDKKINYNESSRLLTFAPFFRPFLRQPRYSRVRLVHPWVQVAVFIELKNALSSYRTLKTIF